ncbi:MAG: 4Fe-4S cluster-binding domain-containing protein [Christensenella sp.]|nr:4Fe-4S cluster-binding domain-containing protein [Christensenella sp.]
MANCMLCPRACGADRSLSRGFCGAERLPRVAKIMLHEWEEPFISGTRGSGAVFFSGCNLGCVYCQNHEIRDGLIGETYDEDRLSEAYLSLQRRGAHTINLVTAAHYVPQVAESLRRAKARGLSIPVVYNSSGYENTAAIRALDGLVDVYLPDWKYVSPLLSERFSNAPDYCAVASEAICEMYRQVGDLMLDGDGIATRGLTIRHLVLPGCVDDSRRVLDEIAMRLSKATHISLMSQYTPQPGTTAFPLNRRITQREYDRVISYALSIGLHNILIQRLDSAQSVFTPQFTDNIK